MRSIAEGSIPPGIARRRKVIIVAPHFAPSNLASTHRSRLFGRHLPDFGWEPVIVTVHHDFYEEALDWKLWELVPPDLRIERVGAIPTKPFRLVGDIAIRGFVPMLRRILRIIDEEGADLLYITIPSFFAAPLGRIVHALRGTPYGIDYSDPWVHVWPASTRRFSKAWASRKLGELLEPVAVRRASLITGVSERTYSGVIARNPHLAAQAVTETMPYGGEVEDHRLAKSLAAPAYLFRDDKKFRVLYAGTMWDGGQPTLERILQSLAAHPEQYANVRFYFVGTGGSPTNPVPQVSPLAERYGLGPDIVVEHPSRISYVDVLTHLEAADALLIIGSAKPHYTPSKIYQSILSGRPILAVLQQESPAVELLLGSGAGQLVTFSDERDLSTIATKFTQAFVKFRQFCSAFDRAQVKTGMVDEWSARAMTQRLAAAFDATLEKHSNAPVSRDSTKPTLRLRLRGARANNA